VGDGAYTAFTLYHHDRERLGASLRSANHAQRLMDGGYTADVDYCFQTDALPVLPYYSDNRLVLYNSLASARENAAGSDVRAAASDAESSAETSFPQ
jgi:2-phosphosulfolactate phosphatase